MSEYTSSLEGWERAMTWSLTGTPDNVELYTDALHMPTFYHIFNGERRDYDTYVKDIRIWRSKVNDYKPKVHQFLRDGDNLAARMSGTIDIENVATNFESFLFAGVDKESGKLLWLIERAISGVSDGAVEHGIN